MCLENSIKSDDASKNVNRGQMIQMKTCSHQNQAGIPDLPETLLPGTVNLLGEGDRFNLEFFKPLAVLRDGEIALQGDLPRDALRDRLLYNALEYYLIPIYICEI